MLYNNKSILYMTRTDNTSREMYNGKQAHPCKHPEDLEDLELGFIANCLRSRYSAQKIVLLLPISKHVESVMR